MGDNHRQYPNEVIELIIDECQNNVSTLRQCSLVSSRWLPRSWYWLFGTDFVLTLDCDWEGELEKVLQTVGSPRTVLGPYIRALRIRGYDLQDYYEGLDDVQLMEIHEPLDMALKQALPHLPNIQKLSLTQITWKSISAMTQNIIFSLPLVSLCWDDVVFTRFPEVFTVTSDNFPNLEELAVYRIAVIRSKRKGRKHRRRKSQNPSLAPSRPLQSPPFHQLHTLKLKLLYEQLHPYLSDFIATAGIQLKSVELELDRRSLYPFDEVRLFPISFTNNIHLTSIRIVLRTLALSGQLTWLVQILRTIPKSACVFVYTSVTVSSSGDIRPSHWEQFDFSPLQNVFLQLKPHPSDSYPLYITFPKPSLAAAQCTNIFKRSLKGLTDSEKVFIGIIEE